MPSNVSIAAATTSAGVDPIFPIKAARPVSAGDLVVLKEHGKIEPATGVLALDNTAASTGPTVISGFITDTPINNTNVLQFRSQKNSAASPNGKSIVLAAQYGGSQQPAYLNGYVYDPKNRVSSLLINESTNGNASASGAYNAVAFACPNGNVGAVFFDVTKSAGAAGSTVLWSSMGGRVVLNPTGALLSQSGYLLNVVALADNSIVVTYQKGDAFLYFQRFNSVTGAVITAETLINNDTGMIGVAMLARKDGGFAVMVGSSSTAANKGDRIYTYDATMAQTNSLVSGGGGLVNHMPNSLNAQVARATAYIAELSDGRLVFMRQNGFQVLSGQVLTQVLLSPCPWDYALGAVGHYHLFVNEDDEVHVAWGRHGTIFNTFFAACTVDGTVITTGFSTFPSANVANPDSPYFRLIAIHLGGRHVMVMRNDYDFSSPINILTLCVISMDKGSTVGTTSILKPNGSGNNVGAMGLVRNNADGVVLASYVDNSVRENKTQYNPIACSILGVASDAAAAGKVAPVLTTGVRNINQTYTGIASFDRNAAAIPGNKGFIAGNTFSMKGV